MRYFSFYIFCLPLMGNLTAALPAGCTGDLNIISTNSSRVPLLWSCSSVDISHMFGSGQNSLLATYTTSSDVQCANVCAPLYAMAAFWYPTTNVCECWEIGDITGTVYYEEKGATWIDFWYGTPPPAQNWGLFTCPDGSYSGSAQGDFGFCESVNVFPAGPPLNISYVACKYYANGQYSVQGPDGYQCYEDLAGLKVSYNYSSPYIVFDRYDFQPKAVTSTTAYSSKTSTTKSNSFTTSVKSSSKSTASTKPTVISTSKASSKKSSSTKANIASTKASSSTKAAVTSTGKLSKASSKKSSSTKVNATSTKAASSTKAAGASTGKSSSKVTLSSTKKAGTTKSSPSTTSSTRSSSKASTHASTATK